MNKIRILLILTVLSLGTVSAASFLHPASAANGKYFDHIVIIAMENQNYADVIGNSAAPFINSMVPFGSVIPNYHSYCSGSSDPACSAGISGCSAACYVAFTSGDTHGVSDGYGTISATNIADRLSAAGLAWKAYCENGCPRGNDHFPFTAYSDLSGNPNVITTSDDFTASTDPIYAELNSATPANYIWLTPTDNHNMHDVSVSVGDAYLQQLLVGSGTFTSPAAGSLLSTSIFRMRTELYLWWDEYDPSPNLQLGFGGTAIKAGYSSPSNSYDEYASLHTIEDNWGLTTIANDAAAPITSDIFGTSGPVPLATSFTISPSTAQTGQTVTFTASPSGGTTPYTETWKFGDGASGSGATITHSYSNPGTFQVSLTTNDSATPANTATSTKTIVIGSPPPPGSLSISISSNPTNPTTGQTVGFTATVTGGTPPYGIGWDFGDGSISVGTSTTHAFSNVGTFNVTAAVTDSSTPARTAVASIFITVSQAPPPPPGLTADFTFNPANPNTGNTVSFTSAVSGGSTPYTYAWNFGDAIGTSTAANPTYSYTSAGTFTVSLQVTDSASATATATHTVTVNNPTTGQFTVSISFSPQNPNTGDIVTFTGHQSNGAAPVQWIWDFGDGNTGTGVSVTHAYSTTGTFIVTLNATDNGGRSASPSVQITVTTPSPSVSGTTGSYCTGLTSQGLEPIVSVDYVNPGNSATSSSTALFDTGAAYSLAPASLATSLGLTLTNGVSVTIKDVGSTPFQAYLFNLTLGFGGTLTVVNVPVAFSNSASEYLIGRQGFLNQVSVTIDSSALTVCFTANTPSSPPPSTCDSDDSSCGGASGGDGDDSGSGGGTGDGDDSGSGGSSSDVFHGLFTGTNGAFSGLPMLLTALPLIGLAAVVTKKHISKRRPKKR